MSSLLTNYSTDKLRAELESQEDQESIFAELLKSEIAKRDAAENAEKNAATNRVLTQQAWEMFHAVRWSDDPAVHNSESQGFKGSQRNVLFFLEHAYGLSAPKAKAALELLMAAKPEEASVDQAVETARTDRRRNGTS